MSDTRHQPETWDAVVKRAGELKANYRWVLLLVMMEQVFVASNFAQHVGHVTRITASVDITDLDLARLAIEAKFKRLGNAWAYEFEVIQEPIQ